MADATIQAFRKSFKFSSELIQWYPGHMEKGMLKMQSTLRNVDCVVEVHDARVAISGRNPNFVKRLLGIKPHILVLNKADLILEKDIPRITSRLKEDGIENIIFTKCIRYQSCPGMKKLVPTAIDLISRQQRFNRREETNLCMMIIGIPNVGKSSIINALRNKNLSRRSASPVGPTPGVTRSVLNKIKVNVYPTMFLIDTPGILPPQITNNEVGLKLALCACLKNSIVSNCVIADFLLYWLNKSSNFRYVDALGLDGPKDDIIHVLTKIAVDYNLVRNIKDVRTNSIVKMPNIDQAADIVLDMFRNGKFGLINLDEELLEQ